MKTIRQALQYFIIGVLLFSLFLPVVTANNVVLKTKVISNKVKVNDWASFYLSIYNNQTLDDIFRISVDQEGVEWSLLTDPPEHGLSGIPIKRHKYETTKLFLKDLHLPRHESKPHIVNVKVTSTNLQREANDLIEIYLLPEEAYLKNVTVTPYFPVQIHPRDTTTLEVDITNNNLRAYDDLTVMLSSLPVNKATLGFDMTEDSAALDRDTLSIVSSTSSIELGPNETKVIKFDLDLPHNLEPFQTTLTLTILDGNDTLYGQSFPLSVAAYRMPFSKETTSTDMFLLKRTETVKVTNQQNIKEEQQILIPVSSFDRFFSSTNPESPILKINGQYHHAFTLSLSPSESMTIIGETNYRIFAYLFLIIVVVVFLYYMFRSPIDITKEAEVVRLQEGGMVDLRVVMTIKNKTHHRYSPVQIIEKIPSIIKFDREKGSMTIAPSQIRKADFGEIVYWTFDLDPQEELIIPYHIKSKLSILGDFSIAPSMLTFELNGHKIHVKSNRLDISSSTKFGE